MTDNSCCTGIIIFGVIFFIIVIITMMSNSHAEKEKAELTASNKKTRANELKRSGFSTTKRIQFQNTEVKIDLENKKVAILFPEYASLKLLNFGEILRCETIQDNSTIASGGIGRAVVGGVLAGGAGAIVGATTRKSHNVVDDLRINITTNNINDPLITITIIENQTQRDTEVYRQAKAFAEKIQATMESIINHNQIALNTYQNTSGSNNNYEDLPEL